MTGHFSGAFLILHKDAEWRETLIGDLFLKVSFFPPQVNVLKYFLKNEKKHPSS